MARTVIEHGYVIPVAENRVIEDGIVAIDGSRIRYVGARAGFDLEGFRADKVVDARGKAVLPGFVNTHTHLIGAYIKGLTEDAPGGKADTAALYKKGFPVVELAQAEDFYWAALTHGMEMVMTGTTTISNTWSNETYTAPAVRDLGVRAILSEMIFELDLSILSAKAMQRPWIPEKAAKGLDAAVELY